MSKKKIIAYTGKPAPISGQYRPSGGSTEITLTEGNRTPPNRFGARQKFFLVDPTVHKK